VKAVITKKGWNISAVPNWHKGYAILAQGLLLKADFWPLPYANLA
jgi:hypothetical protein